VTGTTEPRSGRRESIQRQRNEIERLLADSPSLRRTVGDVIEVETDKARRLAALSMAGFAERPKVSLESLACSADQVLGDWFPGE
jgi:Domain of unknown function DUF29